MIKIFGSWGVHASYFGDPTMSRPFLAGTSSPGEVTDDDIIGEEKADGDDGDVEVMELAPKEVSLLRCSLRNEAVCHMLA